MENTNRIEMREILGVYEQGEAAGTSRGLKAGVTVGALATLVVTGVLLATLCGSGRVRFSSGEPGTGLIGSPPPDATPGLPPGVVPPLAAGTTAAPPLTGTGPVGLPPGGPAAPLVAGLPPAPAPDTQTIRPAPPSELPRPVRLPSD